VCRKRWCFPELGVGIAHRRGPAAPPDAAQAHLYWKKPRYGGVRADAFVPPQLLQDAMVPVALSPSVPEFVPILSMAEVPGGLANW
jgi:hypothetical protein